jgi:hypothetical protein
MDALRARGYFCFKVHGGPTMMAGLPDIIVCANGRFIGLETKLDTDVSAIQAHRHGQIRRAGGYVGVPHSVGEALELVVGVVGPPDGV